MPNIIRYNQLNAIKPLEKSERNSILTELLSSKVSDTTKRQYHHCLRYFCSFLVSGIVGDNAAFSDEDMGEILEQFLDFPRLEAIAYLEKYRQRMLAKKLSPNTINNRIAAVKSLVIHAQKIGRIDWNVDVIESLKITPYRDTTGITPKQFQDLINLLDTSTPKGLRDRAILRLLWDSGLRRAELASLNVSDFCPIESTISIMGKGRLEPETVDLAGKTKDAISNWIEYHPNPIGDAPLFVALDRSSYGKRLTTKSVYDTIRNLGEIAVSHKILSPHRIRHSSITALLDATDGNVRLAQAHARHKNPLITQKYDDNRKKQQGRAANIIADLID